METSEKENKQQEVMTMNKFKKSKIMLTALITGAVAFGGQASVASAESYVLENPDILTLFGDVNYDGTVSLSDAIQLNQYILGNNKDVGNPKNADISDDGTIDVFDLIYLRKQLLGEKPPVGGTLNIDIADIMTGESLEGADITISGVIGLSSFPLGEFHYDPDETITIHGLPTSDRYHYVLDIKNLPENYGNRFGGWDHTFRITFDEDSDTKDLKIRFLDDDTEFNVKCGCFDWTRGDTSIPYAPITITDKDGNLFYQNITSEGIALPDGEYHADLGKVTYPVDLIAPSGPFMKELKEIYPDIDLIDKTNGFDFTVKDGKSDQDVFFDFGPKENSGNIIGICCIDTETGDLVEGCEMKVIEAPDSYAKVIGTFTSEEEKPVEIKGLHHSGQHAYKVVMEKTPEGYTSMEEYVIDSDYVHNFYDSVYFFLVPEEKKDEIAATIYAPNGDTITEDIGTIKVYDMADDTLVAEMKAGEPMILDDGVYYAKLEINDEFSNKYFTTDTIQVDEKYSSYFDFYGYTQFKMQNGIPDRMLDFVVLDKETIGRIISDGIE